MCIANALVAPISTLVKEDYVLLFLVVFGVKLIAFVIASTTIPEVATVSEQTARDYSSILYNRSVTGYRISVELSHDTIMITLRLIGVSLVLLTLYIIYRTLYLLML